MLRSFKRMVFIAAVCGAVLGGTTLGAVPANAGEGPEVKLLDTSFPFDGIFGTYDRASLQRGLQIYTEVCSTCHGLYELSYRNIKALGYTDDQVKAYAAQHQVPDLNDAGVVVQRPARPSDKFVRPFPNAKAAAAANGGAVPPDLALIVKAREGGARYIYSLMQGFKTPPADVKVPEGKYYNEYFPGHVIAMPPPLADGTVTFADGTPNKLEQEAKDIASFLEWASEPELEARHRLGVKVILFLLALTGILIVAKKRIWADVH